MCMCDVVAVGLRVTLHAPNATPNASGSTNHMPQSNATKQ